MTAPVPVAVVGLGNAGFDLHLPALAGLSAARLVGAVDLDETRRARSAGRFGVPVFGDVATMLGEARPTVVVVATPPVSHAAVCEQVFAAGVDVICEKPFAPSVAEGERIARAATQAGRRLALNHEFREMPIFRAVRDAVGRPDTGDLVFVQAWQNMDLPPWKEPGWRGALLAGVLYEAGLHLVDYVLALFGERPRTVSASASSCGTREEATDAVALVTLEFSRGRLAQIVQNRLCPGDTQYFEVRADCAKASLRASFGGRARITAGLLRSKRPHVRLELGAAGLAWSEHGHTRTRLAVNPKEPAMAATRALLARTLEAFRTGAAPPASADDALSGLMVLAAAYESAATGRRVSLGSAADAALRERPLAAGAGAGAALSG